MNVLSLCSGIGGLDLGVKIAVPEARTVCWVERDDYCRRVLLARMSDGSLDAGPIWDDLTTFDGLPWQGVVDCVVAGFPCQDISNAGKREGIREGNRSGLWYEVARVIGEVGPGLCFLENVSALLGRGMDTVLGDLSELGYDAVWGVVSAADVGAPHLRKRVFILAHADGAGREAFWLRTVSPQSEQLRVGGNGSSLADAAGVRQQRLPQVGGSPRTGPEEGRMPEPAGGRDALADTEGQCGELRAAQRGRPGGLAGGGSAVGDTDIQCLEGRKPIWANGYQDTHAGGEGFLFPPGLADRDAWTEFLRRAPNLEPAVRRGAHGVSRRVDRLRCLGNAVVPVQAAAAFRLLARRLECR